MYCMVRIVIHTILCFNIHVVNDMLFILKDSLVTSLYKNYYDR